MLRCHVHVVYVICLVILSCMTWPCFQCVLRLYKCVCMHFEREDHYWFSVTVELSVHVLAWCSPKMQNPQSQVKSHCMTTVHSLTSPDLECLLGLVILFQTGYSYENVITTFGIMRANHNRIAWYQIYITNVYVHILYYYSIHSTSTTWHEATVKLCMCATDTKHIFPTGPVISCISWQYITMHYNVHNLYIYGYCVHFRMWQIMVKLFFTCEWLSWL